MCFRPTDATVCFLDYRTDQSLPLNRRASREWAFKMADVTDSGVLSTASNLVFAGGREGYFYALDARSGQQLWRGMVGGQVSAGPITYEVAGKQYVSVPAGSVIFTYTLRQ